MSVSNWVGGNGDSPQNGYKGYWGLTAPNSVVARPPVTTTFTVAQDNTDIRWMQDRCSHQ